MYHYPVAAMGDGMKRHWLALAAMPLLWGATSPGTGLSDQQVEQFLDGGTSYMSYDPQPIKAWEADVHAALGGKNREAALAALAPRYGLTAPQMTELVRLWVESDAAGFGYGRDKAKQAGLRDAIRRRFLALVADSDRSALVLQAAATSLDGFEECSAADFDALMAGARDRAGDAWLIASSATCGDNFLRAANIGDRPAVAPLIRAAHYGSLAPADALALYAWLTGPDVLARLDPADRDAVAARLVRRYAAMLLETGQTGAAVALFDAQPAPVQALLRRGKIAPAVATIEGLSVPFEEEDSETMLLGIAAGYALHDRKADAEALIAGLGGSQDALRQVACLGLAQPERADGGPCGGEQRIGDNIIAYAMLDHVLHRADDDPYPIAETGFGASRHESYDGLAELGCRLFDRQRFPGICDQLWRSVAYATQVGVDRYDADKQQRLAATLAAMTLPGFVDRRAAELATLEDMAKRARAIGSDDVVAATRASIDPDPAPFAALPLPDQWRRTSAKASAWPKNAAKLPPDFMPVRFERNGNRAAAVSVSQNFDPSGEVSRGGYWIHLSDDGGKSWQAPLYTGLADRFPYVVPAEARMPLLGTDGAIDLEVEVALLDTASITYPPVALATRRQQSDLYLRIPVADLKRDGDGDGFSDIAERHLLLDMAGDDAPMLLGSQPAAACGPLSNEQGARIALLGELFDIKASPLVEPLDMAGSDLDARIGQWGSATSGPSRAIFLRGDPADFACLRSDRPIIVYSPRHIAALATKSPDFRAVEMPAIVFNRARDRGYAIWSAGWTGGTFRLRFEDNRWQLDAISSWIT